MKFYRRWFEATDPDPELLHAQFSAFVKQIPLFYIILSINTLAMAWTLMSLGRPWLTLFAPCALVALCLWRAVHWLRVGARHFGPDEIARHVRTTNLLSPTLAVVFTIWGFLVFMLGDPYQQAQIVFFLALTGLSCSIGLTHFRGAAMSVAFIGVIPFAINFGLFHDGHFRAAGIILTLVAIGMTSIMLDNHRDFAHLVLSRRAVAVKQSETQGLSDENLRLANQDSLTGLANRRAFIAGLRPAALAPDSEAALAFVDLDGFKNINDEFGHEAGDRLIAAVAAAFSALLPVPGALLARLGGDEFAAAFSGPNAISEALAFGEAVVRRLERPLVVGERTHRLGASVGVAVSRAGECDGHELLRRADVAMYNVKSRGRAAVRVYTPELDQARRRQHALAEEIRAGIAEHEFDLHYQPIVDARSHAVVSLEALLRWTRRPEGPVGPDSFIGAAEASGLIHPLGLFALRRACQDLGAFDDAKVCVNVSPAQFHDSGFESQVARILDETQFSARRLSLEVTESYLIDNPERAATAIATLKRMGISVVLDDFGAGYTSVAYLQRYGFDGIKIDRSLCSRIEVDAKARVLVTGVVYLANGLDMPVTAEGVETEEQARLLRLIGCQYLQGFRFCAPKPLAELFAPELAARSTRAA